MGASDSKLVFKNGIFRLSKERHIPPDDPYWDSFWQLPESAEDVFNLFSPADIRRTRDRALENLETLITTLTSRLFLLRHHPSFPDPEIARDRDALNCVRVLTRILPYLYEAESLQAWEEKFFWAPRKRRTRRAVIANEVLFDGSQPSPISPAFDATPRKPEGEGRDDGDKKFEDEFEDAKPLAEELIDTLIDLLFFADFTVSRPQVPLTEGQQQHPKVTYAIWSSGVGCNAAVPITKEWESNRCEVLRLLLTLCSQAMYTSAAVLPQRGVRALTHVCTCPDKQVVLSVLCSLLNPAMKYNPASWRVPYNTLGFKDTRQMLVTYSLQFLLVLVLYPIPEANGSTTPQSPIQTAQKNYYRHFLGRLHRPQDFQFLVDGMTRILNVPLQANGSTSYLPGAVASVAAQAAQSSTSSPNLAPEVLMLFWEVTQCNKRFRSFIVDTERAHDFVILALFYALAYKTDASRQGVVRMCAFLLQTLSVERNFGVNLNKRFEAQDTLPPAIRIVGFRGTYGDFLVQSIYNLITTSQGKLSAIYPALLAVINNIAPYLESLSATTSARLMQLFASMSSPSFLLANESNHDLLQSLLESLNSIIEHQYTKNPELVLAILRNRKRVEALRNFTLESGQEELERRNRRRKDAGGPNATTGAGTDSLDALASSRNSLESLTSPTTPHSRTATLHHRPSHHVSSQEDDGTFAIGDDDDDEDEDEDEDEDGDSDSDDARPTPAPSSENQSRASSVASSNRHATTPTATNPAAPAAATEDAVPTQLRGMSEKARGKMPAGSRSFSRQNSTTSLGSVSGSVSGGGNGGTGSATPSLSLGGLGTGCVGNFEPTAQWIDSWLPELPLHTLLALIQQLTALLPRNSNLSNTPSSPPSSDQSTITPTPEPSTEEAHLLRQRVQAVRLVGVEASAPRVHSFEWTIPALGWYESMVWSFVFSAELQAAKGNSGIWNATAVRLFRVDAAPPPGPSFASPRGAVDAVGSNIVSRIGAINLRAPRERSGSRGGGGER